MSMLITQVELPRHSRQWAAALRVAFSVLVLGLGTACSNAPENAGAAAGGGRGRGGPVPVEIQTLVERPVEQTSEFVGTVKSLKTTTVQAQVEGFLLKVHVKSGDRVEPGKVLFEVDASSQQAAVSSLESVRVAREADAIFARQQAERAKKLLAVGAMSQHDAGCITHRDGGIEDFDEGPLARELVIDLANRHHLFANESSGRHGSSPMLISS